ncbi:MAG: UDP-N-acetylglucosamine 2-epimerase [Methanomicrobiales archaeon 53_19]|uniref:non-hydrolyzing UDP-N-acetylglucosamine 2-epimerase n=1 Tax=Methanocalculus sp. TaxID=2004547 RepID=UPI00074925BD|nr:UDP-N-acetylglucosamine 2-epimerase (non-hydrolyzing) [Methanocalculus sp.]KUK69648.1 MAG: UDP-N-acetylglucosamine 2-epimerase [Methanocalculus sp. 52_23]KUL02853.1 MAG: UDP-N-acetylglucosamine 2-epimerase [Methanomicrobiales archaeon 53_19]HIJ05921.1 UDP-N-acetylglucosamine 2-epimerase (non-hydrolyzing) [Methanocalculus sp.]
MKIATIVGARPQFIKCAPVSQAIRQRHEEILIHTGQHYDPGMSGAFFEELSIPEPDYNLSIGSGSQGVQTGRMLASIEEVLLAEEPEMVLVYGDTNSTLAGALAAAKLHIPVAHVEAGLRSFDRSMPEEINRVLTDHISALLFCPTGTAVANLAAEGITQGVHLVGDVMVDALRQNLPRAEVSSTILSDLGVEAGEYYLATVHRASNTDQEANLRGIMQAFSELDSPVIYPAHPRTKKYLAAYGVVPGAHVRIIDPLPYLDMLALMGAARAVLTDSGGVQKEAYILKVPCVTLRENTEWVETVQDGWNVLVGSDTRKILDAVRSCVRGGRPHSERFGDGRAAGRIMALLSEYLG